METGQQRLLNHQQNEQKLSFSQLNNGQTNVYKKKLFNIVSGISGVILLIILERIFYEMLVDNEVTLLHSVQNLLGVIDPITSDQDAGTVKYWKFKGNFGWDLLGYLDIFKYNFLILTAYIGIFFVAFDSLLAIKIGYVTIYAYFIVAFTDLLYQGPRPFWKSNTIGSPVCQNAYSHPSRSAFLLLFMIYYSVYCFRRRVMNRDVEVPRLYESKNRWMEAILSVIVVVLLLLKYIMGLDFLVNIVLAVLYFLIYYFTLKFMDSHVDNIILKSSIQERSAKKYVFYWLLYVVLSFFFITMLYSSMELYPSTSWVKNYIQCASSNDSLNQDLSYQQVLGPWFTFLQSSCLFGLIGAVFGVAYTYRHTVKNYNWFLGTTKARVYRSLLLIVCMIPSLFITIFQYNIINSSFVKEIGLNEFFFSAAHYFLLYAFIFGVLPIIFKKVKLIEEPEDANFRPSNLSFFKESMLKDKPSFEFASNSFDKQDTIKE